jgi:hypothetical protein
MVEKKLKTLNKAIEFIELSFGIQILSFYFSKKNNNFLEIKKNFNKEP